MFCYQCEETVKGTGCTVKGVCGKEDAIAAKEDVLIYICQGCFRTFNSEPPAH
jgi:hydroxylamine reductase